MTGRVDRSAGVVAMLVAPHARPALLGLRRVGSSGVALNAGVPVVRRPYIPLRPIRRGVVRNASFDGVCPGVDRKDDWSRGVEINAADCTEFG